SFIGRERELAGIRRLLASQRLVTLTGAGGVGKTRLALQVCAGAVGEFEHGVYFADLAPISDPSFVVSAVAQSLGVKEGAGRTLLESLKDHLRDRAMLLFHDNFEQLLPAASRVAELLTAAPHLKILVT